MTKSITWVALLWLLASCAGPVKVDHAPWPIGYGYLPDGLLNSKRLGQRTVEFLKDAGVRLSDARKDPYKTVRELYAETEGQNEDTRRLAIAEVCVDSARRFERGDPEVAIGLYLTAARQGFPSIQKTKRTNIDKLLLGFYNHSCGQVADLVFERRPTWSLNTPYPRAQGTQSLQVLTTVSLDLQLGEFDDLRPVDEMNIKGFETRATTRGVGAALVATQEATEERINSDPNIPSVGTSIPLTATLEFDGRGVVTLRLHDVWLSDQADVAKRRVTLASDFTAPLANIMAMSPRGNIGLKGMLRPDSVTNRIALYRIEPFRKNKIPIVFSHGLMSKPATWKAAWNVLLADRKIRENYQFWAFMYPTGLPLMYPAAGLQQSLRDIRQRHDPNDHYETDNMVLIGHSMGGLMTSMQVRETSPALYYQFFKVPFDELNVGEQTKTSLRTLLFSPQQRYIKRAVFVAAPHLGSSIADGFVGRIGSKLIKMPGNILSQRETLLGSFNDLGNAFFAEPANGISRLKLNNPSLKFIHGQPIHSWVSCHSVIGDRGKGDTPNSSDGIVPYQSSHLEGAVSEKLVPSGHDAHAHPEGIEEIRRILLEHLK
jgi:hypothetical protein